MPYIAVDDFRGGMDRRRLSLASTPGTLYTIKNGHLTRGGEIQKRKSFVSTYSLPAGTFGLQAASSALYVFGSASEPAGMPSSVMYQRLEAASGEAMTAVLWTDVFNGLVYAIAEYADGSIEHFYNGTRIADWAGGSGNPATQGRLAKTFGDFVYSPAASVLYRCVIRDPSDWTGGGTGVDQINMANHAAGSESLTALGIYQEQLAVFARSTTQLWVMDPDPANNVRVRTLDNFGTRSPGSIVQFGSNDLVLLTDQGIRSMRPRDSSGAPNVTGIGEPIDEFVIDLMHDLSDADITGAKAIFEQEDGRYWLGLGTTWPVFTFFPTSKISAWSYYAPGFEAEHFTQLNNREYVRAGDTIYLYGGTDHDTYDATTEVEVITNFLAGGKPGHFKGWSGLDLGIEGTWDAWLLTDPTNHNIRSYIGRFSRETFSQRWNAVAAHSPHAALRLVHQGAGAAKIGNLVMHYDGQEAKPGGF